MKRLLVALSLWSCAAMAQTIITPGGAATENMARAKFPQALVVPRPGADGVLAYRALENGEGTFLLVSTTNISVAPVVNANYPYAPLTDFEVVAHLGQEPLMLVTKRGAFSSLDEAMQLQRPVSLGGFGAQSVCAYATKLLGHRFKREIIYVPYKASANLHMDATSGVLDLSCQPADVLSTFVAAGKWDVMANLGSGFPELPKIKNLPPINISFFLLARKGDPEVAKFVPQDSRRQQAQIVAQNEQTFWQQVSRQTH